MSNSYSRRSKKHPKKQKSNESQKRKKIHHDNRRIQKLLCSEYSEFNEPVLVESSFAETTRDGRGLRQVTLALTKTNLIIAADVFGICNRNYFCSRKTDPSTECFELISVFPLKYIRLSIFHRRNRRTLKVRFIISGKIKYYESSETRDSIIWAKWFNHIRNILTQRARSSSLSETSAGSSSSTSTVCCLSDEIKDLDCHMSPYCKFSNFADNYKPLWADKNTYLGQNYEELENGKYKSLPLKISETDIDVVRNYLTMETSTVYRRSWPKYEMINHKMRNYSLNKLNNYEASRADINTPIKLNRFGSGVEENCQMKLYLKPIYESKFHSQADNVSVDYCSLIEEGVSIWEKASANRARNRHYRRYGIAVVAHFLSAFGPWPIYPGERESVQNRRSSSTVDLRRNTADPIISLPLSRRQLIASISFNDLKCKRNISVEAFNKGRVILFWTPDYWYRPKSVINSYKETRSQLTLIQKYRLERENLVKSQSSINFFRKRKHSQNVQPNQSGFFIKRVFSVNNFKSQNKSNKKYQKRQNDDSSIGQLRKLLKLNIKITAWDLDSSTLSKQITLIERDLFLRIPSIEIQILVYEKSSRNAPNFGAWIAFSHRISCLVAFEIVSIKRLDMRARLISRFIITADKCYFMGNFQSCRSILAGLQSPAIYRLRSTWSCIRKYYSTKYETMEKLCKVFRSPRLKMYQKAWKKYELSSPCIPYVGDLLIKVLDFENYTQRKNDNIKRKVLNNNEVKNEIKDIQKTGILRFLSSILAISKHKFKNSSKSLNKSRWSKKQQTLVRNTLHQWRNYAVQRKSEKRINEDPRKLIIKKVLNWVEKCQKRAKEYNYSGHSLAWEYLLKARYKEEKDNFYTSLKIEPPFLQ